MAQWSQVEQLMLELVNRARLDPAGEAARFGITLNEGLAPGTLSATAKQVLAPDTRLNDAARAHSQWMLDTDSFSHTGANGSNPGQRMTAAGYSFAGNWTWSENIAWQGTTGPMSANSFIVDEHENLFLSPGHRENLLNGGFQEVGIGAISGQFNGSSAVFNALMTTQAFARSGSGVFVTGVAYTDANADQFYGIGEARAGLTVAAAAGGAAGQTTTAQAAGYAVEVATGLATVTFSGGGLAASITAMVDASGSKPRSA